MVLVAASFLLAISLMAGDISVPEKETLVGEPEAPALKAPPNPEGTAGTERAWLGDTLGLDHREDASSRSLSPKSFEDAEGRLLGSGPPPSFSPWPRGVWEEPVCQVKLEPRGTPSPPLLEVVGLPNAHDRGFLAAVSRSSWAAGELETFGLCPTVTPHGLLSSLGRAGDALADPGSHRVLLLHLEEAFGFGF
ncbi:hypothetical protein JRQ81_008950 [Phrynocephalus forsythii]|uniref:Anti-Mullerian hormone N-terminal domain-containing protein n=1 Tax=Phrynocephalus forsythii TaxID=171643 RepID=A0A9Q1ASY0_9SAUR|nr:hypothetical protein JRQ81_008950 [Phrynocephalus forsythii]